MNASPENVLITTSPYTTLLYFLANDLTKIQRTAFFFIRARKYEPQEKEQISGIIPASYFFREPAVKVRFRNHRLLQRLYTALQMVTSKAVPYFILHISKNLRWPFLNSAEIWAYDNSPLAKALIGRRNYVFLEEGLFTYENADIYASKASFSRKLQIFLAAPFGVRGLGTTPQAQRIILTGSAPIPECYSNKNLEILSISEQWAKADDAKRDFIMKFFALSREDTEALRSCKIILVDQPLSDDGLITRNEQIEMIRKILERNNPSQVLLKTHYRSSINYREIFPDVLIWDKLTPMELLSLCGVSFTRAITVNSTAVLSFPESVKIEWLGQNPDDPCFSHLSPASRKLLSDFVNRMPVPNRIKTQSLKENL